MNKLQNMKYLTTHTYQPTKQSLLWPHAIFSTLRMVREIKSTQIEVILCVSDTSWNTHASQRKTTL